MSTFKSFEEIEAWQEGRKLVRAVRSICKRDNVKRDFAFVDQITRAARSITTNIAEGSDAMTIPEFINFLGYAKRSAAEVRAHLYDAIDDGYISEEEFVDLNALALKIQRMIAKLIHYLQSLDHDYKRTYKEESTSELVN